MSESPETPATPGADEPAALVPDDATAVRQPDGEPATAEPAAPVTTPARTPPVWTPPAPPPDTAGASGASGLTAAAADRPEVAVGAAFAGGLVLALILKRLAR
ncbi:MAG: hypothetical protein ABI355_10080 [Solirubrobacteraceae bacterium]